MTLTDMRISQAIARLRFEVRVDGGPTLDAVPPSRLLEGHTARHGVVGNALNLIKIFIRELSQTFYSIFVQNLIKYASWDRRGCL